MPDFDECPRFVVRRIRDPKPSEAPMRYVMSGIVALSVFSMGEVASAHSGHAHVGRVWVSGSTSSSKCGLISKICGGSYETYLCGGIDCNPRRGYEGCGQCNPKCYLGAPCDCCEHRVHYTLPFGKFGRMLKDEAYAGRAYKVEAPGPLARVRGQKSFQVAR